MSSSWISSHRRAHVSRIPAMSSFRPGCVKIPALSDATALGMLGSADSRNRDAGICEGFVMGGFALASL